MGDDLEGLAQTRTLIGREWQGVVLAVVFERLFATPDFATDLNDLARAARLKKSGMHYGRYRHLVFDRAGEPCWTCGQVVVRGVSAGRNLFLCAKCQS